MGNSPGRAGRTRARAAVTAAAVVVVSASALALFWSRRVQHPTPDAPAAAPVAAEPTPPRPETSGEPLPDLAARFRAARAVVTCGRTTGEAVFVAPDRALAGVECPEGQAQLRLADGRELLARVRTGAPPGTSGLQVPGADAPFLAPGASVTLPDGEGVRVALESGGVETVAEATARGLVPVDDRPLLAIGDAAAPVAGPVVDVRGELVAIVPAVAPDPERPGLAVPIEAFAGLLGRPVSPAWEAAVAKALDEERRAASELWNSLVRTAVLLSAGDGGPGSLSLVVGRVSAGRPPTEVVRLVVDPPAPACDLFGRVAAWRPGPRALEGLAVPARLRARLERLPAPPNGMKLWVGAGSGRTTCEDSEVPFGARIAVLGSDPPMPVAYPYTNAGASATDAGRLAGRATPRLPPAPLPAPDGDPAAQEAAARADAAEREADRELGWRQAFREANDRVARAAQQRRSLQARRDEARERFQTGLEQQLDLEIEAARIDERQAAEALEELERRASFDAVPRAWRRP